MPVIWPTARSYNLQKLPEFEEIFSLVFEGLWLSVRIVQNGKSDLGSLLTKGHDFLRDLALKILALFSFRGIGYP